MTSCTDFFKASRLDGRGIVVLGAGGGGIGTATCRALSGAGAKVLCVDRDAAQAEQAAKSSGGVALVADVTDRNEMVSIFEKASNLFGNSLSGIVDIVGLMRPGPLASFDDNATAQQFDVVLRHAILTVQVGASVLARNGGGTMAFVGSITGHRALTDQSMYGVAKAALHQLVRCAANELGPSGIRVNGVAPGVVRTPRLVNVFSAETWATISKANPLRRCAEPDDIAKALLYLSSDLSSYVNGHILRLDGGTSNIGFIGDFELGASIRR